MKNLMVFLFVSSLLLIGLNVNATSTIISSTEDEFVCCESFGYGSNMIKTASTYETVAKNKCSSCVLDVTTGLEKCAVGGSKKIVDNKYCDTNSLITVLSPNGGENIIIGKTYTISWKSYNLALGDSVRIDLYKNGIYQNQIAFNQPVNGKYSWTPSINGKILTGSGYKIRITKSYDTSNSVYDESNNYFTLTTTNNSIPVISGISGPQALNENSLGSWTVKAYDSAGGNLSYSVNWGDIYQKDLTTSSGLAVEISQSSTFTHIYSHAGEYKPIFTVTNTSGQSAVTSLTVNVGNTTSVCPTGCTCSGEATSCPIEPPSITCKTCVGGIATGKTDSNNCMIYTCPVITIMIDGCLSGFKYNIKTGQKCDNYNENNFCSSGYKYNPITGELCTTTSSTTVVAPTAIDTGNGTNNSSWQTLKKGSKGEFVKMIQEFLGLAVDGSYGTQTQTKVMEWQAQNGLKADGIFGSQSAMEAGLAN